MRYSDKTPPVPTGPDVSFPLLHQVTIALAITSTIRYLVAEIHGHDNTFTLIPSHTNALM